MQSTYISPFIKRTQPIPLSRQSYSQSQPSECMHSGQSIPCRHAPMPSILILNMSNQQANGNISNRHCCAQTAKGNIVILLDTPCFKHAKYLSPFIKRTQPIPLYRQSYSQSQPSECMHSGRRSIPCRHAPMPSILILNMSNQQANGNISNRHCCAQTAKGNIVILLDTLCFEHAKYLSPFIKRTEHTVWLYDSIFKVTHPGWSLTCQPAITAICVSTRTFRFWQLIKKRMVSGCVLTSHILHAKKFKASFFQGMDSLGASSFSPSSKFILGVKRGGCENIWKNDGTKPSIYHAVTVNPRSHRHLGIIFIFTSQRQLDTSHAVVGFASGSGCGQFWWARLDVNRWILERPQIHVW